MMFARSIGDENPVYHDAAISGYSGDGGLATNAQIGDSYAMTLDAFDNLYVADASFFVVREINAVTQIISTVAGSDIGMGIADSELNAGGVLSNAVQFYGVSGISFDPAGNLFVSGSNSYNVIEINLAAPVLPLTWPGNFGPAPVLNESIVNSGNQPLTITSASVTSPFTLAAAANSSFCTFPLHAARAELVPGCTHVSIFR